MSRTSRPKPSSVGTSPKSPSKPPTTRTVSAPVLKSRWTPRPHNDDPTVKTHDFAYLSGVAPPTLTAKMIASVKSIFTGLLAEPYLLRTLLFIFGGCCSNVYTLESILSLSSSTGTLITFLQFIAIALYTLPSQLTFTVISPPDPPPLQPTQTVWFPRLKNRRVPLRQWCIFAAQFVVINLLNNAAFGYKISLPLHIILRSAGPVASMAVGYIWKGQAYSTRKVLSVMLLFLGVVLAALSDAGSGTSPSTNGAEKETSSGLKNGTTTNESRTGGMADPVFSGQLTGFMLLSLALLLSAIMGIWSDTIYTRYGRNSAMASEQLFYGHLLSLPFFALQHNTIRQQMTTLLSAATAPSVLACAQPSMTSNITSTTNLLHQLNNPSALSPWRRILTNLNVPSAANLLILNSITQIVCISGVHHLSTQTSALTVSIVLNIRKVVSLLLSIWLFGNNLPLGVLFGAALVFVGGGVYGIPDPKRKDAKGDMKKAQEMERKRLAGGVGGKRESKKDR